MAENKESMFPVEVKNKIHGPFEALAYAAGGVIGAYLGWKAGSEAVEYVNSLSESSGVLEVLVRNHPVMSHFITMGIGSGIVAPWTRLGGNLLDHLFGTYHK